MKTCPNCKKEYADDLQYCLEDGTVLEGSKKKSEMETVVLPSEQSVVTKLIEPAERTKKISEEKPLNTVNQVDSIDRTSPSDASASSFFYSWSPRILSVLRIITGFLFLWHGSQKLFAFPPPPPQMAGPLTGFTIFSGILEFAGGILILIGLFTRWTAFILSGMMAVAYWGWHGLSGKGFLPMMNGGELAALYCFVFLYLFFAGGGSWSLDSLLKKNA